MVPDGLADLGLEDIIGEKMIQQLDRRDEQTRQRYVELRDPSLLLFERLLYLQSRLMLSISDEVDGFLPKFARPSPVQVVVATSAVGSFRSLRIAHKLLLEGYFLEMHNIMRMVEQWCECAVAVEVYPEVAEQILKHGMETRYVWKYMNQLRRANTNAGKLYNKMRDTFHQLSQRAHPLSVAFSLITRKDTKGVTLLLSGGFSEEMFRKDSLSLANMAKNALIVVRRHFREVPPDWDTTFEDIIRLINLRHGTVATTR
jgi:hypothetical protein